MNVLVDASVWIDHLHRADLGLVRLLQSSEVVMHSAVLGELACGTLPNRRELLSLWSALPPAAEVSPAEALRLIEDRRLWARPWLDRRPAYRFYPVVACQTLDARPSAVASG